MFGSDRLYYNVGRATIVFLWAVSVWWLGKMVVGHFKMKRELKEAAEGKAKEN